MTVDSLTLVALGVVGFLTGLLTTIAAVFYLRRTQIVEEILENVINDLSNDENLQKSLFNIGGILGQGAKTGLGINLPGGNRGGKFKMQDFLMQIAGQFLVGKMSQAVPGAGEVVEAAQQVSEAKRFF